MEVGLVVSLVNFCNGKSIQCRVTIFALVNGFPMVVEWFHAYWTEARTKRAVKRPCYLSSVTRYHVACVQLEIMRLRYLMGKVGNSEEYNKWYSNTSCSQSMELCFLDNFNNKA